MTDLQKKYEFLQKVKSPSVENIKEIKHLATNNAINYNNLVVKAFFDEDEIKNKMEDNNKILMSLYKKWYDSVVNYTEAIQSGKLDSQLSSCPQKDVENFKNCYINFVKDNKINPHSEEFGSVFSSEDSALEIFNYIKKNHTLFYRYREEYIPFYIQDKAFVHLQKNFSNITPEMRLYLNIKPENIAPLVKCVIKKINETNQNCYFKYSIDEMFDRTDNFLFYTDYKHANQTVELIESIKKERPELFEGCYVPIYMGSINGYIGFGEEPNKDKVGSGKSFTGLRADALQEYSKNMDSSVFEKYDIPKDPFLFMLNKSTVEELEKNGYDVKNRNNINLSK